MGWLHLRRKRGESRGRSLPVRASRSESNSSSSGLDANDEEPEDDQEEAATTTAAEVEPTEKAPRIDPGPNPFSPTVFAPPAPTAIPGDN